MSGSEKQSWIKNITTGVCYLYELTTDLMHPHTGMLEYVNKEINLAFVR